MNNVGFSQNNENKRLKKLHIAIDSSQRDKKIYPNPNDYTINLDNNNRLRHVNSIRVLESMIPNNQYTISSNKYLDILTSSGETSILLTPQNIGNGTELATYLTTLITDITVTYDDKTGKLTFENTSASDITFLFETGGNADCSIQNVIGGNMEDLTIPPGPGNSVVLPNPINLQSNTYIDLDIEELPDISKKLMITKNLNLFRFKRFVMNVEWGANQYYNANDQTTYNYFTPMEFTKFTIKLYDDNGHIYDTNDADNYIIFEMTMLADDSPENVSFFPAPPPSIKNKEINIKQETDIAYFDLDNKEVKENFKPTINSETQIEEPKETIISNNLDTQTEKPKETIISNNLDTQTEKPKETIITNNPETQIEEPKETIISNNPETRTEEPKDNLEILKNKIEIYVKENKIPIIGISTFIVIFLIIFFKIRKK